MGHRLAGDFGADLRAINGLSHRMLTLTLRGLGCDGMMERRAFATIPPTVEYELTPLGRSLILPVSALAEWAFDRQPEIGAARAKYDASAVAASSAS